jgi:PhnB protein
MAADCWQTDTASANAGTAVRAGRDTARRASPVARPASRDREDGDRAVASSSPEIRRRRMSVKPVPDGYPHVSPYLIVDGAAAAIDFYTSVLGAKERMRMPGPDGKIGHAELQIGDSVVMLADEFPDMGHRSPPKIGGTPVSIGVYVEDVDATFAKAIASGAKELSPVEDKFYGDRSGQFEDPFGHRWTVQTHVEDVSPEEMARRAAQMMGG